MCKFKRIAQNQNKQVKMLNISYSSVYASLNVTEGSHMTSYRQLV